MQRICKGQLNFDFETSVEWQIDPEFFDYPQYQFMKFTLYKHNQEIKFYSQLLSLRQFSDFLKTKINQRNLKEYYQVVQKIGRGGFAYIYEIENKFTKEHFAAKSFIRTTLEEKEHGIESLINEINLMRQMKHPNLIKLIEVYESKNSYYLITPLYSGQSLLDVLLKYGEFSEEQTQNILYQLLLALKYLAEQNIIHRDLKLQNIMFQNHNHKQIVLIDLGLSTKCNQEKYLFTRCGTPGFVAPEIANCYDPEQKFSPMSDIFSFGCVAHFLLLQTPVFNAKTYHETLVLNKLCQIDFSQPMYEKLSPQGQISSQFIQLKKARNFLMRLLKFDPKARMSVIQALQHHFIQEYLDNENVGEECEEFNPLNSFMPSKTNELDFSKYSSKKIHTIVSNSENNTYQQFDSTKMLITSLKQLDILKIKPLSFTCKQISPILQTVPQSPIVQQFLIKQQFGREQLNSVSESSEEADESKISCSIDETDKNSQSKSFTRVVRRSSYFSQFKCQQNNSPSPLSRYKQDGILVIDDRKIQCMCKKAHSQEKKDYF